MTEREMPPEVEDEIVRRLRTGDPRVRVFWTDEEAEGAMLEAMREREES